MRTAFPKQLGSLGLCQDCSWLAVMAVVHLPAGQFGGGGEGNVENSTTFIDHGHPIGSLLKNLENQGRKNVSENHKVVQPS